MDSLLPSEIARLIYGYLGQICPGAAKIFLESCPMLVECLTEQKKGRRIVTRVNGMTLTDILEDYCDAQYIVEESKKEHKPPDRIHQKLSTKLTSFLELQAASQSELRDDYENPCRTTAPVDSEPVLLEHAGPCNAAEDVPLVKNISVQTYEPPEDSTEQAVEQPPVLDPAPDAESNNKVQRRRKSPSKRNSAGPSRDATSDESVACQLSPKAFIKPMLDNHQLHEKIAENINQILCDTVPDTTTVAVRKGCLQDSLTELDNCIKSVVEKTQADPIFEKFMVDMLTSIDCEIADEGHTSNLFDNLNQSGEVAEENSDEASVISPLSLVSDIIQESPPADVLSLLNMPMTSQNSLASPSLNFNADTDITLDHDVGLNPPQQDHAVLDDNQQTSGNGKGKKKQVARKQAVSCTTASNQGDTTRDVPLKARLRSASNNQAVRDEVNDSAENTIIQVSTITASVPNNSTLKSSQLETIPPTSKAGTIPSILNFKPESEITKHTITTDASDSLNKVLKKIPNNTIIDIVFTDENTSPTAMPSLNAQNEEAIRSIIGATSASQTAKNCQKIPAQQTDNTVKQCNDTRRNILELAIMNSSLQSPNKPKSLTRCPGSNKESQIFETTEFLEPAEIIRHLPPNPTCSTNRVGKIFLPGSLPLPIGSSEILFRNRKKKEEKLCNLVKIAPKGDLEEVCNPLVVRRNLKSTKYAKENLKLKTIIAPDRNMTQGSSAEQSDAPKTFINVKAGSFPNVLNLLPMQQSVSSGSNTSSGTVFLSTTGCSSMPNILSPMLIVQSPLISSHTSQNKSDASKTNASMNPTPPKQDDSIERQQHLHRRSLSTPRRDRGHIRTLDFSTPPRSNTFQRKCFTSPKNKQVKPRGGRILSPNTSQKISRAAKIVRAGLFEADEIQPTSTLTKSKTKKKTFKKGVISDAEKVVLASCRTENLKDNSPMLSNDHVEASKCVHFPDTGNVTTAEAPNENECTSSSLDSVKKNTQACHGSPGMNCEALLKSTPAAIVSEALQCLEIFEQCMERNEETIEMSPTTAVLTSMSEVNRPKDVEHSEAAKKETYSDRGSKTPTTSSQDVGKFPNEMIVNMFPGNVHPEDDPTSESLTIANKQASKMQSEQPIEVIPLNLSEISSTSDDTSQVDSQDSENTSAPLQIEPTQCVSEGMSVSEIIANEMENPHCTESPETLSDTMDSGDDDCQPSSSKSTVMCRVIPEKELPGKNTQTEWDFEWRNLIANQTHEQNLKNKVDKFKRCGDKEIADRKRNKFESLSNENSSPEVVSSSKVKGKTRSHQPATKNSAAPQTSTSCDTDECMDSTSDERKSVKESKNCEQQLLTNTLKRNDDDGEPKFTSSVRKWKSVRRDNKKQYLAPKKRIIPRARMLKQSLVSSTDEWSSTENLQSQDHSYRRTQLSTQQKTKKANLETEVPTTHSESHVQEKHLETLLISQNEIIQGLESLKESKEKLLVSPTSSSSSEGSLVIQSPKSPTENVITRNEMQPETGVNTPGEKNDYTAILVLPGIKSISCTPERSQECNQEFTPGKNFLKGQTPDHLELTLINTPTFPPTPTISFTTVACSSPISPWDISYYSPSTVKVINTQKQMKLVEDEKQIEKETVTSQCMSELGETRSIDYCDSSEATVAKLLQAAKCRIGLQKSDSKKCQKSKNLKDKTCASDKHLDKKLGKSKKNELRDLSNPSFDVASTTQNIESESEIRKPENILKCLLQKETTEISSTCSISHLQHNSEAKKPSISSSSAHSLGSKHKKVCTTLSKLGKGIKVRKPKSTYVCTTVHGKMGHPGVIIRKQRSKTPKKSPVNLNKCCRQKSQEARSLNTEIEMETVSREAELDTQLKQRSKKSKNSEGKKRICRKKKQKHKECASKLPTAGKEDSMTASDLKHCNESEEAEERLLKLLEPICKIITSQDSVSVKPTTTKRQKPKATEKTANLRNIKSGTSIKGKKSVAGEAQNYCDNQMSSNLIKTKEGDERCSDSQDGSIFTKYGQCSSKLTKEQTISCNTEASQIADATMLVEGGNNSNLIFQTESQISKCKDGDQNSLNIAAPAIQSHSHLQNENKPRVNIDEIELKMRRLADESESDDSMPSLEICSSPESEETSKMITARLAQHLEISSSNVCEDVENDDIFNSEVLNSKNLNTSCTTESERCNKTQASDILDVSESVNTLETQNKNTHSKVSSDIHTFKQCNKVATYKVLYEPTIRLHHFKPLKRLKPRCYRFIYDKLITVVKLCVDTPTTIFTHDNPQTSREVCKEKRKTLSQERNTGQELCLDGIGSKATRSYQERQNKSSEILPTCSTSSDRDENKYRKRTSGRASSEYARYSKHRKSTPSRRREDRKDKYHSTKRRYDSNSYKKVDNTRNKIDSTDFKSSRESLHSPKSKLIKTKFAKVPTSAIKKTSSEDEKQSNSKCGKTIESALLINVESDPAHLHKDQHSHINYSTNVVTSQKELPLIKKSHPLTDDDLMDFALVDNQDGSREVPTKEVIPPFCPPAFMHVGRHTLPLKKRRTPSETTSSSTVTSASLSPTKQQNGENPQDMLLEVGVDNFLSILHGDGTYQAKSLE